MFEPKKVLFLGGYVGKTSLIKCLTGKQPDDRPERTEGVSTIRHKYQFQDRGGFKEIELIDVGSLNGSLSGCEQHIKVADCLVLVYDVSNLKSLDEVSGLLDVYEQIKIERHFLKRAPIILVGTKCDFLYEEDAANRLENFIKKKEIAPENVFTVSAKRGENVEDLLSRIASPEINYDSLVFSYGKKAGLFSLTRVRLRLMSCKDGVKLLKQEAKDYAGPARETFKQWGYPYKK